MIPKFHKKPERYRFIAGVSNATTKRLAIDVNLCLKLIKKIHKGYCKSIYNRNGYNYFWRVDNSREVLDKLNNVNNPSIHTYDFLLYILEVVRVRTGVRRELAARVDVNVLVRSCGEDG